jgi:hypothetical protein
MRQDARLMHGGSAALSTWAADPPGRFEKLGFAPKRPKITAKMPFS